MYESLLITQKRYEREGMGWGARYPLAYATGNEYSQSPHRNANPIRIHKKTRNFDEPAERASGDLNSIKQVIDMSSRL